MKPGQNLTYSKIFSLLNDYDICYKTHITLSATHEVAVPYLGKLKVESSCVSKSVLFKIKSQRFSCPLILMFAIFKTAFFNFFFWSLLDVFVLFLIFVLPYGEINLYIKQLMFYLLTEHKYSRTVLISHLLWQSLACLHRQYIISDVIT